MLTDHLSEISDDNLLDANRLIPKEQVESRKNFSLHLRPNNERGLPEVANFFVKHIEIKLRR